MNETTTAAYPEFDTEQLNEILAGIADQYQNMLNSFLTSHEQTFDGNFDALGIGQAFLELTAATLKNPEKLLETQVKAWNAYTGLWLGTAGAMLGSTEGQMDAAHRKDRRFSHEAWDNNPFFSFIKESYLVTSEAIQSVVANQEGLDEAAARKARFFTKQFVDALSPTNFFLTNPEVLEATLASKGENLLKGLQNFIDDFDPQAGQLRIKMTDTDAFRLGENIAASPGKVVFQNELFQLLQYAPSTTQTFQRPLLIIPPWINKYYVLDLQAENSLIKWLVEQGHSVFVISWVNPDASLAATDFEDYALRGALAAVDAVQQATGMAQINVVGYCIGGTLLAATLAYMQAKNDKRVVSATFFVTLLDFSIPGDLGVFIDEEQLANLEKVMSERGYHDGKEMAATFNMLRANDLIWSFYVNNYLLGKDPFPFDLLYWNSDSTCLPAKMHSTYLRLMYLNNSFKEAGGMTIAGVPIDLRSIQTPACFISTENDHIAPWEGTYLSACLLSGPVRFILGKSGHIAGIVNPPAAHKYGYYTGSAPAMAAQDWYNKASSHDGSWWPEWQSWLVPFAGEQVPACHPGIGALPALEDAPGSYVKVRR